VLFRSLRLLPRAIPAGRVDIVSPTYSGHEAAWRAAGAPVHAIPSHDLSASDADVLLLVNPNNPDGRAVGREALTALAASRAQRGLWTVVDESFVETDPALSVAGHDCERLVVLRSFGKFYGLAGLRLGFVIAPGDLAARLRDQQGEWPVSAEAVVMGTEAYADAAWRARTEAQLRDRAAAFDLALGEAGLRVLGGTSLFRLVEIADAATAFDRLCGAGILTRPFAHRADWLRLGLPRREDFARVTLALGEIAR